MSKTHRVNGIRLGFRSGLEEAIADQLEAAGVPVDYESEKFKYVKPARKASYTPDFLLPNGIVIETKGRFVVKDRQKHLILKDQYPDLDIRFVFSNANNRISKRSKTTYAKWCEKHGFVFANKRIPSDWLKEPVSQARLKAIEQAIEGECPQYQQLMERKR